MSDHLLAVVSTSVMMMIICLGMVTIVDYIDLNGVVDSFFTGIAAANTKYKEIVDQSFISIGYAMFILLFLVSIGLGIRFGSIGESFAFVIIMTILARLTKLLRCGVDAGLSDFSMPSSCVVSSGMVARGGTGLITTQIDHGAHLLSPIYYLDVITVVIIATVSAPSILKDALKRPTNEFE